MTLNLQKGDALDMVKADGAKLSKGQFGVNWGALPSGEAVDLDASVILLDSDRKVIDTVFFNHKTSSDGAVIHSGDDLTGDTDGDDGLDNEVVSIDFESTKATYIACVINSYKKQDFKDIPFIGVRIYEGTPIKVNEVLATFKLDNNPEFSGRISAILGIFQKINGTWSFKAVGKPTADKDLNEIVTNAPSNF